MNVNIKHLVWKLHTRPLDSDERYRGVCCDTALGVFVISMNDEYYRVVLNRHDGSDSVLSEYCNTIEDAKELTEKCFLKTVAGCLEPCDKESLDELSKIWSENK